MSKQFNTREEWLLALVQEIKPLFDKVNLPYPASLRVSCGFPSTKAFSAKHQRTGECWDMSASKDGAHEIFISPVLDSPTEVAHTLVHELVHAAVGTKAGHRGAFKRYAVELGLRGPMTATHAGPELTTQLKEMTEKLGDYPHGALTKNKLRRKQPTRMLKVMCTQCGYTVRTTQTWLVVGLPTCVCGTKMTQMPTKISQEVKVILADIFPGLLGRK